MFDLATWQNGTLTLNIPIAVPFQIVAWAAVVSLPLIFLWAAIHSWPEIKKFAGPISNKLPDGQPQKTVAWFSILFSPFWVILFLVTFGILLRVIWNFPDVFFAAPENAAPDAVSSLIDLRWYTLGLVALLTALGGLIAVPLSILRNFAIERQTKTAEENLTTSLINTAVEGLGAEKTVSRIGRPVKINDHTEIQWRGEDFRNVGPTNADKWQTFETTEPNLEVRIGAIYTLERIARDNPTHHVRIMNILCAYIRENSPAMKAKRHDLGKWPDFPTETTDAKLDQRCEDLKVRKKELDKWVASQKPLRDDIQIALSVLGNRHKLWTEFDRARYTKVHYRIDLRNSNLRLANAVDMNFNNAIFDGSKLEGASFAHTELNGASLRHACFENADFIGAKLNRAKLSHSHVEGADFSFSEMHKAQFGFSRLEVSKFIGAKLNEAALSSARMEGADLTGANLEGANANRTDFRYCNWQNTKVGFEADGSDFRGAQNLKQSQLNRMIGNPHTLLPEGLVDQKNPSIPDRWPFPKPAYVKTSTVMPIEIPEYPYRRDKVPYSFQCTIGEVPLGTGTPRSLKDPYPTDHPLTNLD